MQVEGEGGFRAPAHLGPPLISQRP